jgi:hypothetical protein
MDVRPSTLRGPLSAPLRKGALSFFAALIVIVGLANTSCETPPPPPGPFYYFRVMWNGPDASTQATIGFSAIDTPTDDMKVYYDVLDHGTDLSKYAYSQAVTTTNTMYNMNNVFVRLTKLQPATNYYFVAANAKNKSVRYWFRTAPSTSNTQLSIVAGGDSRNNREPRLNANRLVAKLRPDAVMFGGDMIDVGLEAEWKVWFQDWQETIAEDGRVTPIIAARGNHERTNDQIENLFDTPKGVHYAVSAGGSLLRVYTLNSESSIAGTQTDWLKSDLAASTGTIWKFAHYHRPMRPHVKRKGDLETAYRHWAPLFYQFGMNLVVECDAHVVKATWPLRPSSDKGSSDGFIRDDRRGTVYVGEGGWGAPLRNDDDRRAWTRDSGSFNHFQWMFVSPSRVEVRTVNVDNQASVEALSDADRFRMPAGISLWKPSNGEVITLER